MGAHVLVVDDDPQILRMLTEVLTKRGFGVDIAHDGEEAYKRATEHAPDLLVTDVMMPKLDGWSLVRKLRNDPKLAKLPVIFLTALTTDDARVQAFRLGADDYINKPFKFNDLVARIEKVLVAKQPDGRKPPTSGLAGDLAQVGLSTLLVLIEMERKTGALQLTSADGRSGRILVRNGKVIAAGLDGAKQATGANAVYVMLTFTAGRFELTMRNVDDEAQIQQSTTHLLMEGARLMDEALAPDAEEQLDVSAIGDWGDEERTPVVAAAKLADSVRRSARASIPPYSLPITLAELARSPNAIKSTTPVASKPAQPEPAPPAARRRPSALLLVGCVLAAAAGAATFAIKPKPAPAPALDLQADATAIGAALDRGIAAAQMRADGVAAMPMLRTAIDTDAATMQDMVAHEKLLEPAAGEVIELFQLRDGTPTSVLRAPATARQLVPAEQPRARVDGSSVAVIASAPIKNQQGVAAGTLAVSVTVDLKEAAGPLARRTRGATLTGLDKPLVLAPADDVAAPSVNVPIANKVVPELQLQVRVAPSAASATTPAWLAPTRYAAFAFAGLLLLLYVAFAARASARD